MSNPSPPAPWETQLQQVEPSNLAILSDDTGILNCLSQIKGVLEAINNNLAVALHALRDHHQDIGDAGTNDQAREQAINNLEAVVLRQTADISRLVSAAGASGGTASAKPPKLAEPSKFDGTDKSKATSFRVDVAFYLHISYPYATADEQIAYILSVLEGKAKEWLEPYLEEEVMRGNQVSWLHNLAEFRKQFDACWNVSNKTNVSRVKLMALKQGKKTVHDYCKDFQTYSQGLAYNDIFLRNHFHDELSVEICCMIMAQNFEHIGSAVTLQQVAEKALEIDQRLAEFDEQEKSSSGHKSSSKSASKSSPAARESPGINCLSGIRCTCWDLTKRP